MVHPAADAPAAAAGMAVVSLLGAHTQQDGCEPSMHERPNHVNSDP